MYFLKLNIFNGFFYGKMINNKPFLEMEFHSYHEFVKLQVCYIYSLITVGNGSGLTGQWIKKRNFLDVLTSG